MVVPAPGSPLRILVAEDNELLRALATIVLEDAGYEVLHAEDGVEALEVIDAHQPHAMVLDINMPRLDGFGVLEALRARESSSPRTIVLTTLHRPVDMERAFRLGASDSVDKSSMVELLVQRVVRATRSVARAP